MEKKTIKEILMESNDNLEALQERLNEANELAETVLPTGFESVAAESIIKRISSFKHKNNLEDLKQAEWFLKRLILTEEMKERKNGKEN